MKYLVKFFVVTFLLLICTHASAEQETVYLDMKFILNNSKAGKGAQDFLKESFEENQKGRLAVGNYADFILLDTNVLNVPLPDIRFTRVLLTVVGGEIVFDRRNTSVDATPLP